MLLNNTTPSPFCGEILNLPILGKIRKFEPPPFMKGIFNYGFSILPHKFPRTKVKLKNT